MVRDLFGIEPDLWQKLALESFASGDTDKQRISMQACAGPGKSAVLSWAAWNFLLCYHSEGEHPKGAAISMTHTNLVDNLWSELNKWMQRNAYLKDRFTWTQGKIFAKDHKETWFISARSFKPTANKEERGRALSGLHAKYVLFLIDEAGSVPPEVGKTAEQALSNCEFGKILLAGNPTSHDGLLYEASKSKDWFKIRINGDPKDPMRSPRIDIDWASEQIKKHGRDDPWVQSMILGRFPDVSINTLLSDKDIDKAENRAYQANEIEMSEKRLGVDVARFGSDSSIIFPRQGLKAFNYVEMRKADGPMLADRVMGAMNKWKDVDKINVDGTGGYGASCIDFLRQANVSGVFEINFSQSAGNPTKFFNKRAEMYWNMAQWIKKKGWIPKNPKLRKELTAVQYFFRGDKIQLESKDQIKARLGFSPDLADALALTFAQPDSLKEGRVPGATEQHMGDGGMVSADEYNPFGSKKKIKKRGMAKSYKPFR